MEVRRGVQDDQVGPGADEQARRLPLFVSEVIFYAAQEALRNAARHGRGADADRKLHLDVVIDCTPGLQIAIGDDGVGRARNLDATPGRANGEAAGAGSGLLFHSAMLAVVGGVLSVTDRLDGGTRVVIEVPSLERLK